MPLRALFLDAGNTLIRERPSRFEIYASGARSRGIDVDEARMNGIMRRAHDELPAVVRGSFRYTDGWFEAYVERVFHHHLGLARTELAPLSTELFARFSDPATFELFPGALELLDRARNMGLKVGIVSNWSTRLPRILDGLGVTPRVEFALCSASERAEKPDRRIFERALELAGVPADAALHAGDDLEKDVLGARRVGIRSVLVDHARRHGALGVPRVEDLADLLHVLERLAA